VRNLRSHAPRAWPIAFCLAASSVGLGACGLLDASPPSDAAIANVDASRGTDARGSEAQGWNSTCEPLPPLPGPLHPLPGPNCVYVATGALCRYASGNETCICLASSSEESHSIWDCYEEEDAGSVQTDEAGVDGGSTCEAGACEVDAGEGGDATTFRCGMDTCHTGQLCATTIGGGVLRSVSPLWTAAARRVRPTPPLVGSGCPSQGASRRRGDRALWVASRSRPPAARARTVRASSQRVR
jgi:hypothetical protein